MTSPFGSISTKVALSSSTAYEVQTKNPVLAKGEPFYELDTAAVKIGDGQRPYNSLPYAGIVNVSGPQGEQGEVGPQGEQGDPGISAYQVALNNGFVGSQSAWLTSLIGPPGADSTVPGPPGDTGATGLQGPKGDTGDTGPQGPPGTLTDGSVTTAKLAVGAVISDRIANNAVTNTHITDAAISQAKLAATGFLTTAINLRELASNKGIAGGYASLDGTGKVPAAQLPSFVDDVLEYANLAGFPGTGETGKIYVALDTGKTYRWSGSAYVEISPSDVNSVAGKTGAVTLVVNDISNATTTGKAVMLATDAANARTLIGAGTSSLAIGTTGTTAAAGNDARLSDTRTPTDNTVTNAKVATGAAIALAKLATGYMQGQRNGVVTTTKFDVLTEAQYQALVTAGTVQSDTAYFRS